jgi:hypothetical protein
MKREQSFFSTEQGGRIKKVIVSFTYLFSVIPKLNNQQLVNESEHKAFGIIEILYLR